MKSATLKKIIEELQKNGFPNVEYNKRFQYFDFHNEFDIMDNYVELTYNKQFNKFNVNIHPIETHNTVELTEVTKRIYKLTLLVKTLNNILAEQEVTRFVI